MYTWKVEVYLKNGNEMEALYHGPEAETGEVAKQLFKDDHLNTILDLRTKDDKATIFIRLNEIMAMEIRPGK